MTTKDQTEKDVCLLNKEEQREIRKEQPQGGEGGQVTVLPVVAHKYVPCETDSVANSCTGGQGHNPSHTGNQNMGNQTWATKTKTKTWAIKPNLKK